MLGTGGVMLLKKSKTEDMVEIASVLDLKKSKHHLYGRSRMKKSANFTTNGPPFRSRFCPFDFVTKRKKNNPPPSTEYFFFARKAVIDG